MARAAILIRLGPESVDIVVANEMFCTWPASSALRRSSNPFRAVSGRVLSHARRVPGGSSGQAVYCSLIEADMRSRSVAGSKSHSPTGSGSPGA